MRIVIGAVLLVAICALMLLVERLTRPDADDLRRLTEAEEKDEHEENNHDMAIG